MHVPAQIATLLRSVYFGGNWTAVNLKDTLAGVDWQQATTRVHSLNTIAALVYHIHYYIQAVSGVLRQEPLTASDKYSFDHPPIQSEEDWQHLLNKVWTETEALTGMIEQLPESRPGEIFANGKYGNYYRNLHGLIEHAHYHLGQIVIIKKMLPAEVM